jgi:hypothetical protein
VNAERDRMDKEEFALVAASGTGPVADSDSYADEDEKQTVDRLIQQAMEQSDEQSERKLDPEY